MGFNYSSSENENKYIRRISGMMICCLIISFVRVIIYCSKKKDCVLSYNVDWKGKWKFSGLHEFFSIHASKQETDSFFNIVLPGNIMFSVNSLFDFFFLRHSKSGISFTSGIAGVKTIRSTRNLSSYSFQTR
jgi:hypothetical protein